MVINKSIWMGEQNARWDNSRKKPIRQRKLIVTQKHNCPIAIK